MSPPIKWVTINANNIIVTFERRTVDSNVIIIHIVHYIIYFNKKLLLYYIHNTETTKLKHTNMSEDADLMVEYIKGGGRINSVQLAGHVYQIPCECLFLPKGG